MPVLDNIVLDETNEEFNYALDFVRHTDRLVYLTGKAGTGKTTFLKYLKQITNKNMVIVAPTGVAAMNAGGQTIHSFFQIKPGIYYPGDKRLRTSAGFEDTDKSTIYDHFKPNKEKIELIRKLQLLVIDEISMVRCDLLDVVDRLLRVFRKRLFEPFGGIQVILIGDTFQLPPIADHEQWEILKRFYDSPFFFNAAVIEQYKPVYIELKKIYRQRDQEFIDLLNSIRINHVSQPELMALNNRYNPVFVPPQNTNYITLATHNKLVDETNHTKLNALPGEMKTFEAAVTGIFPETIFPTDKGLQLKAEAQIMFIKNDKQKRFYNGKIAKIKDFVDDKILIEIPGNEDITIEKEEWENIRYAWNDKKGEIEEEVIGTFSQYPIKLAWAITIHKSQGLTFENVIADLGGAFAPGQVYVALSRCTSIDGIVLKTRIESNAIKTDPAALKFAQNEMPGTLISRELNSGKADYCYKNAREAVKAGNITGAADFLLTAIQFRNDTGTEIFRRYLVVIAYRLQKNNLIQNKIILELKNKNEAAIKIKQGAGKHVGDTKSGKTLIDQVNNLTNDLKQKNQKLQEAEKMITNLKTVLATTTKLQEQESE